MWLGFPLSFWQSIFFWATSIAAVAGAISISSAFISAVVGYQISDIVQSDANQRIAEAAVRTKEAELKLEQLRNANLELQKQVHGREITDLQHDQVIAAAKGLKIPDLVTYIAHDFEAHMYGFSIFFLFQELGMNGRVVMMDNIPPLQPGVMYCGTGTAEDVTFSKILMDAGIVGVGAPGGDFGRDKDGNKIVPPYCPPGSVFVGVKNPLSTMRTPKKLQ
jgi:hypothetical protein